MRPRWIDVKRTLRVILEKVDVTLELSGILTRIYAGSVFVRHSLLALHTVSLLSLPNAFSLIITDFFNVFESSRYLLEH